MKLNPKKGKNSKVMSISNYGCQQILLHPTQEIKSILEFICGESNKLYNMGLYYARQIYFKCHRFVSKYETEKLLKNNPHFKCLYSHVAQQALRSVYEGLMSYKSLLKLYQTGQLIYLPKLPKYRKKGLYQVSYPKTDIQLTKEGIRLGLGKQVKAWFGITNLEIPRPSNLDFSKIKEVRIIPRNRYFYAEYVYQKDEIEKPSLDENKVLGIDHGIDNWLTCISNVNTCFIIDGKHLKSVNCWYNQQIATIKEEKPQGFWSNKLAKITEKRNRQIRDAVNKTARMITNHCLENQIGKVIFGWNNGQKNESNLGQKTNQKFVQIPTARLKERIAQLCLVYGIQFRETEESYTSKASFLDDDELPKYGEKPDGWQPSGKRIERGLYQSKNGFIVNADVNGAANIIRKGSTTLINVSVVSMGALTRPQRLCFWPAKKMRSNVDLSRCEASA